MQIEIPVSIGELIDKITILEIKAEKITDQRALQLIDLELTLLTDKMKAADLTTAIYPLRQQLYVINRQLWDIENFKRECERDQKFGERFVEAARNVYMYNDARADVKRQINQLTGSTIQEVKSHSAY
jgi:hypothetical protein